MFLPATVTNGDTVVLVSAPLLADPTGEAAISAVRRVRVPTTCRPPSPGWT